MAKRRHESTPTGRAVIPSGSDLDPEAVMVMPDGRHMQKTVFGLTEEQIERIRAGYVCVKCLEEYASAFPDQCSVCKFPMRERQSEEFAKDFRGGIAFGPSTTIDEEYEIAEETIQREAYDKARKLGLILPKWY